MTPRSRRSGSACLGLAPPAIEVSAELSAVSALAARSVAAALALSRKPIGPPVSAIACDARSHAVHPWGIVDPTYPALQRLRTYALNHPSGVGTTLVHTAITVFLLR